MRARPGTTIAAAVALAVVAGVLGGCAPVSEADRPVVVGAVEPADGIRPDCSDVGCATIAPALFGTLTVLDPGGELQLELAESIRSAAELVADAGEAETVPSATDDPRFEIVVRSDAAFADGEPITAASFVDSWRRIAASGDSDTVAALFAPFRGYTDDPTVDLVESGALELIDERTFVVHLAAAMADFPAQLSLPLFAPRTERELSPAGGDPRDPSASGPYMIDPDDGWRAGERLQLVPNPEYRGPRIPQNAGLDLRFLGDPDVTIGEFLVGDLDLIAPLPAQRWADAAPVLGDRLVTGALPELIAVAFAGSLGDFAGEDGALRRSAVALALDRPDLAEFALRGQAVAADSFLPDPAMPAAFTFPHDQERADGSWQAADEISSFAGTLVIERVGDGVSNAVANSVDDMLDAALRVPVTSARYVSEGSYQAALTGEDPAEPGPRLIRATAYSPAWSAFLAEGALMPEGGLSSTELDALRALRDADSFAASREALEEAQSVFARELPVIPLVVPLGAVAVSGALDGVELGWGAVPRWESIRVVG